MTTNTQRIVISDYWPMIEDLAKVATKDCRMCPLYKQPYGHRCELSKALYKLDDVIDTRNTVCKDLVIEWAAGRALDSRFDDIAYGQVQSDDGWVGSGVIDGELKAAGEE